MTSISPAKLADSLTQLQQLFTRADKNTDNALSKTEFSTAASGIAGLSGASDADKDALFSQMDTDHDGKLTTTEVSSGIDLASKVQDALLKAQELMSGKSLMDILSGTSDSSSNSFLGSDSSTSSVPGGSMNLADMLSGTSDTSSNDSYTAMLQSYIAKYNETAAASTSTATPTTTQTA